MSLLTMGDRRSVGVMHDADDFAPTTRAGWRSAGGGSREQLGQQWVFLSHGLVGNHCDLTIAWRGHEGGLVNLQAIVLPWVELAAGLMLLVGFRTRAAALLVAGMMAMFTVAIAIAVAKGLDMSCGCFASQGSAEDPISWRTIVRDTSRLLLAVYVFVFDHRPLGLDRLFGRRESDAAKEPS